jgi:CubicO group peptidase (beta-lactamase class C family)
LTINDATHDSISPLQQIDIAYKNYDPNPKLTRKWMYSNASYQLLGLLIEKIAQKPLAEVLATDITLPLHLPSIHFPNKSQAFLLKEYQNNQTKITNFSNEYAAGGLVSNARDLESFVRHLFVNKDLLPEKQYGELMAFISTSDHFYALTNVKAPQFGLGVFKWDIPPYKEILNYPGVLREGFTSAYMVVDNNVIIIQSNTYNNNDFTILWPHRLFTQLLAKQSTIIN